MKKVKIAGTGLYAPGAPIDNKELMLLTGIEFDSRKTEEKLGIKKRHIAHLRGIEETTADFAVKAAEEAIEDAGIDPQNVNLFIVATDTPEYVTPATSIIVQGRIQKKQKYTGAFDISASCASFTTAIDTAARITACDPEINHAVVIGVYNMPAHIRTGDSFGYSIFADGAGAFLLEKTQDNSSSDYKTGQLVTDGTQWDYIGIYSGGTKKPVTHELLDKEEYGLQLLQNLPGKRNVELWPQVIKKLLEKGDTKLSQIDHILFTQINSSVIKEVMEILNMPLSKTTMVMDRYGYTGSACIPMAFHHAVKEKRITRGMKVITIASGAGLAVGANLFIY